MFLFFGVVFVFWLRFDLIVFVVFVPFVLYACVCVLCMGVAGLLWLSVLFHCMCFCCLFLLCCDLLLIHFF